MKPVWGIILLLLVAALVGIEVFSNKAMRRLGIEPSPAARWLRIVNVVAVVAVVSFAIWVIFKD